MSTRTHTLEIVESNAPVIKYEGKIDKTLLFFGHQDRFQESLIKKMNEFVTKIEDKIANYKFSNGAMLNLIIEPSGINYNLYLSLVYTGDDSANKPDKIYWIDYTKTQVNNAKYHFESKTITVTKTDFDRIFKNKSEVNETISCYFVRHGKATHNAVMIVNLERNTNLVKPLSDTAIIDGGNILTKLTEKIDYIFVSDLIRTQQTASLFLQGYSGKTPEKIYVLACLHELNSRNDGLDKPIEPPYYYYENETTCNHNFQDGFYRKNPKICDKITIKNADTRIDKIKELDWSKYEPYFTSNHRTPDNQQICNDYHFLGIALDIIFGSSVPTNARSLNGGKPKRPTRKSRKSQKLRKPRKSRKSTR
jgi:hypothetical protein